MLPDCDHTPSPRRRPGESTPRTSVYGADSISRASLLPVAGDENCPIRRQAVPSDLPGTGRSLHQLDLRKRDFTDIEVVPISEEHSAKTAFDALIVKAAISAAKVVYGQNPVVYPLMAGSGPMYPLTQALGTPAFSAGVGYADSNVHAPNENIRLEDYFEGIRFVGELIRQFGTGN